MKLLHEAENEKKLDVRVIESQLSRGRVSQKDIDQTSKALPDDSENALWVNVEELSAESHADDTRQ